MQVQYGSTILASGGVSGTVGVALNGRAIVDEADLFRAITATLYSRGNKATEFSFGIWWSFNTRGLAEGFVLAHFASLPASELLTVTCGDGEATTYAYQMAGAVLAEVSAAELVGSSVRMHYVFRGGVFSAETVAPSSEDQVLKRGTVALAQNDASAAISFGAAFGGKPVVQIQVNKPTSADDAVTDWCADDGEITAAGFVARGQPIPSSGYVLNWEAISP